MKESMRNENKAPLLTEVLPSSGSRNCNHKWQVVKEESTGDTRVLILACSHCGQSMVSRPLMSENKQEKPLLMERNG